MFDDMLYDDMVHDSLYLRGRHGGTVYGYMGDPVWVPHPYNVVEMDYDNFFYWRFMHAFVVMFFVTVLGFGRGLWLIANFLHLPLSDSDETEGDDCDCDCVFEEKYLDAWRESAGEDYDVLIKNKKRLGDLKKCTIMENTPNGTVVMFYHNEDESFWYYSDSKLVPVKYLDTVCRHYTTMFQCKNLYVHVDDIIEEKKKELEEKEKEDMEKENMEKEDQKKDSVDEEKSDEEKEKSVFASFKNYQNSNETNLRNRKHNQQNNKNNKTNKTNKTNHKNTFVVERANRYSYKGGISEYQMLKKQLQNVGSMKKLDFSSFKKMMESKNNGAKKGTEKDGSATV
jgi:hypothetical protein